MGGAHGRIVTYLYASDYLLGYAMGCLFFESLCCSARQVKEGQVKKASSLFPAPLFLALKISEFCFDPLVTTQVYFTVTSNSLLSTAVPALVALIFSLAVPLGKSAGKSKLI